MDQRGWRAPKVAGMVGERGAKAVGITWDRPGTGGEEKGEEERPADTGQMWEEVGCLSMARGLPLPST